MSSLKWFIHKEMYFFSLISYGMAVKFELPLTVLLICIILYKCTVNWRKRPKFSEGPHFGLQFFLKTCLSGFLTSNPLLQRYLSDFSILKTQHFVYPIVLFFSGIFTTILCFLFCIFFDCFFDVLLFCCQLQNWMVNDEEYGQELWN